MAAQKPPVPAKISTNISSSIGLPAIRARMRCSKSASSLGTGYTGMQGGAEVQESRGGLNPKVRIN